MKRRDLLKHSLFAGAASLAVPRILQANPANQCSMKKTPAQPEGPFYPVVDQVDTDADLIRVSGANQIARGEIVIIEGVLTDQFCHPVAGALVEIWQACDTGKYDHPSDPNPAALDPNFQYWGKAVTDKNGFYRFRTIIPGAYPAGGNWVRPPHVHYKISALGYKELITQMYFSGNDLNAKDRILRSLPQSEQEKVIVQFRTIEKIPHPVGKFDISIEKVLI